MRLCFFSNEMQLVLVGIFTTTSRPTYHPNALKVGNLWGSVPQSEIYFRYFVARENILCSLSSSFYFSWFLLVNTELLASCHFNRILPC